MRFLVRFCCPKCGHVFCRRSGQSPYRIRRGFFSGFGYQCPECGTMSRRAIVWARALWAWPLAVAAAYLAVRFLHHDPALVRLRQGQAALFGALAGLSMLPAVVLLRIGTGMVAIPDVETDQRRGWWRSLLCLAATLLALSLLGFLTHDWSGCAFVLGAGLAIWSMYYLTAGKEPAERRKSLDAQNLEDPR